MKKYALIVLAMLFLYVKKAYCQQQTNSYKNAAEVYREYAAKTKCPERARYLIKMAEWNECMVDVLAGRKSGCGVTPSGTAPSCSADQGQSNNSTSNTSGTSPATYIGSVSNEDMANSIKGAIEGT